MVEEAVGLGALVVDEGAVFRLLLVFFYDIWRDLQKMSLENIHESRFSPQSRGILEERNMISLCSGKEAHCFHETAVMGLIK